MKLKLNSMSKVLCAGLFLNVFASQAAFALPTAAVVLGDSFSSGEAGRWRGNSVESASSAGYARTDGAYLDSLVNPLDIGRVYESQSYRNGCNRSHTAPVHHLNISYLPIAEPFDKTINIACSGARNKHLWPLAEGGERFKGEEPQITRLGQLNSAYDVKLIVVGVGGNDMGFSDAITNCGVAWIKKHWTLWDDNASCIGHLKNQTIPRLWDVYGKTSKTIDLIRKEMARFGKIERQDYRIVITGYPAIIAGFHDNRYDAGYRRVPGRCPFNGPDSQYVADVLMPKLNGMYEALAHEKQIDFVNIKDAFGNHKLCEQGAGRAFSGNSNGTPSEQNMEWVRFLDTTGSNPDALIAYLLKFDKLHRELNVKPEEWEALRASYAGDQGSLSESLHPNQHGQKAVGFCLRNWWENKAHYAGLFGCSNPYDTTMGVRVDPLPYPTWTSIWADQQIPDKARFTGRLTQKRTVGAASKEMAGMMRMELKIDHARMGDLRITITDPNGQSYLIKDYNLNDTRPFPPIWRSFWVDAEFLPGEWTLSILDNQMGVAGTFRDFRLYWY